METFAGPRDERRRARRTEQPEVKVSLIGPNGQPLDPGTVLIDLCHDGLGLETGSPFKAGETLRFRLELPSGPIGGTAEVRWVIPHRRGYRCGARIQRLGWLHARRLYDFLYPGKPPVLRALDALAAFCAVAMLVLFLLEMLGLPVEDLGSRLGSLLGP